jgi:hypothetical protein
LNGIGRDNPVAIWQVEGVVKDGRLGKGPEIPVDVGDKVDRSELVEGDANDPSGEFAAGSRRRWRDAICDMADLKILSAPAEDRQ